jgi:hypothetical protein
VGQRQKAQAGVRRLVDAVQDQRVEVDVESISVALQEGPVRPPA